MGILEVVYRLIGRGTTEEPEEKPPQNMNEVIEKLPKSYQDYATQELPYRRASAIIFIILCLVCGTPVWWHATTVYRAPMKNVAAGEKIDLNIRIELTPTDSKTSSAIPSLIDNITHKLNEGDVPVSLRIHWNIVGANMRSLESIKSDIPENSDSVTVRLALVSEEQWSHFSINYAYLTCSEFTMIQMNDDIQKTASRIGNLVWEVLIDIPHLESIVKRDLREKMPPWQIATLPLSHQKRLVWDSAALSGEYIVQVVFLHDNNGLGTKEEAKRRTETVDNVWRFAHLVKNITRLQISSEHLWDFEISNHLQKDVQERWTLTQDSMHNVLKEVDMQLQTVESAAPVLKMIILETEKPVIILDAQGEDSRGVAVASWGSVVARNDDTDVRLLAALRVLLGLDSELSGGRLSEGCPLSMWELKRLRLRAYLDNRLRAASAIRALHKLAEGIDNIVISDEVASLVNDAVEALSQSETDPNRPKLEVVAEARRKADSALSDPSLLALLYFPSDQKVAVYLPIMVPTLVPLGASIVTILNWIRSLILKKK